MRYLMLACDYDGTIAHHGQVDSSTRAMLEKVAASGRKLLLVTGRELEDLQTVCPDLNLFEWVVAENGALLYQPATKSTRALAPPPPPEFVARLREREVQPLSVGQVIVSTWEPHEATVLEAIRDLGLELQLIFNKGAVMVLPAGINKATGLAAALQEMSMSAHNLVGVGDAENDHAFLAICECSAAVSNALPPLKERADLVLNADHGAGVAELAARLIQNDLQDVRDRLGRHHLLLGHEDDNREVKIAPHGESLLIAGPSASGKSTAATAFMERLAESHYQFCVIDPEGDYGGFEEAVNLGTNDRAPDVEEVLEVLKTPEENVVVNLVGLPLADRPPFFSKLLSRLQDLHVRTGRPHWLIIDEAHHLLPKAWEPAARSLRQDFHQVLLITVHPNEVSPAVLGCVSTVLAVGQTSDNTLMDFSSALGEQAPPPGVKLESGEALLWRRGGDQPPRRVRIVPGKAERRRHSRKYAEGELPPDRSFYFRGRAGKLNLRAQNLFLFLQLAEGVDDETWLYHLKRGDYSRWLREGVKDESLAAVCQEIERSDLGAGESRASMRKVIEEHYTVPASSSSGREAAKQGEAAS